MTEGPLLQAPLLDAQGVRIAVDGAPVIPSLDLSTRGERALLIGDAGPLVQALTGTSAVPAQDPDAEPMPATIVHGQLSVLGKDVQQGHHREVCGAAPLDPPLPPRWTVAELVTCSARLAGAKRREASALCDAALDRMVLRAQSRRRISTLNRLERRAAVLAAAIVRDPRTVVIEDPFHELDAREAPLMMGGDGRAVQGRTAIERHSRIRLGHTESDLLVGASDICLLRGGALVMHAGAAELLGEGRVYELTVQRGADALRHELLERGIELMGGPLHFSIVMPDALGPSDVLAAAAKARASVVTCVPLIG